MAISSQEGLSQREQQVCRLVSSSSIVVLKLMRRRLPADWDRLPASVFRSGFCQLQLCASNSILWYLLCCRFSINSQQSPGARISGICFRSTIVTSLASCETALQSMAAVLSP